ncbi:MAG: NUDIX domain-containing protein [Negativicutes bacterium]|nr:NUDIX domain-containing protein [Negativicutes bacterium]
MKGKVSAGLMMYRFRRGHLEVFLGHPGGPYFRRRDLGVWGIPKGKVEEGEQLIETAVREFGEETGISLDGVKPERDFIPLEMVRLQSGKQVHAWAFRGNHPDDQPIQSILYSIEWPPRSGREIEVPELDTGRFFPIWTARKKITPSQLPFLDRLEEKVKDQLWSNRTPWNPSKKMNNFKPKSPSSTEKDSLPLSGNRNEERTK